MLLGAHLPVAGGVHKAVELARELECTALQIFCKSPRQWACPPPDPGAAKTFRQAREAAGLACVAAHDSYLINLAAPDEALREKSMRALEEELLRAELLGCDYVVTHCGAHMQKDCPPEEGMAAGLERLGASLIEVLRAHPKLKVRLALENTAAQGTCLGGPFSHLRTVLRTLDRARLGRRVGVCFDTCHAFAAGYALHTPAGWKATAAELEAEVGLERVVLVHLNDSKGECGRHLDRHAHLGEGAISPQGLQRVIRFAPFKQVPFILETPDMETRAGDNLEKARLLAGRKR